MLVKEPHWMIVTLERSSKVALFLTALGYKMKTMMLQFSTKWVHRPRACRPEKAVDAFGLQPDFDIEQADAEAAYTQCDLKGTDTLVRLPEDRWPDE